MGRDLVESVFQRQHTHLAVDELEVSARLVVQPRVVDHGVAQRFEDRKRESPRQARIVEPLCPRILIEVPEDLPRLAQHPADAAELAGLGIGQMVQNEPD